MRASLLYPKVDSNAYTRPAGCEAGSASRFNIESWGRVYRRRSWVNKRNLLNLFVWGTFACLPWAANAQDSKTVVGPPEVNGAVRYDVSPVRLGDMASASGPTHSDKHQQQ